MSREKIAVLSNVNMDFSVRMLKREYEIFDGEGYGNELGAMLNPQSAYRIFNPGITFLIMDLMEVIGHTLEVRDAAEAVERWFGTLESCLSAEQIYYISDACLWGPELEVMSDPGRKHALEALWQKRLKALCGSYPNVRIFPYRRVAEALGEERFFSPKTWYLGKILHTVEAQRRLCGLIGEKIALQRRVPKKALLLDLDNTLWGGLAGEAEHTPVALSEEREGLAYKNLQRVILQMQRQGVLLGIVSKNNEGDAMEILAHHPHQVLRPECFAARRINWEPKHENIREIAAELNLGLDSFVFWDDSPAERELVSAMLPEVTVPDFPNRPEELAQAMVEIYRKYFEKSVVTKEDLEKTRQYAENAARNDLRSKTVDFDAYLKKLCIVITARDPAENIQRLTQLVNKTNQFNLTSRRFDQAQMQQILEDPGKKVFLYQVEDCFGDSGIVAAGIVDFCNVPVIEELVMSCRVMGRNIEYAIVEDMENAVASFGFSSLHALYLPTPKNKPVEALYDKLGYTVIEEIEGGGKVYGIDLADRPKRAYHARVIPYAEGRHVAQALRNRGKDERRNICVD